MARTDAGHKGASMDATERDRLAEWIKEKWKHGPCPVCGANSYGPGEDIALLFPEAGPDSGLNATPPRGAYAVVPILCLVCGYTILINAAVAGIAVGPPTAGN